MGRMRRRRGRQRAQDQGRQLGREIRTARQATGLSTARASARAGVSRSTWERIEAGFPGVAVGTLCAVTDAVGLDLVVRAYPGSGLRLRDRGQLAIAQRLVALADSSWSAGLEVTAGDHGQAIDLVFARGDEIVAVEIIRHLGDFQAQYRSASLKRDWLARHHQRPTRLVLAIEDLRANRAALAPIEALVGSALPAGSRRVLDALRTGTALSSDGMLWVRRRAG